jgi:hypothetical protein
VVTARQELRHQLRGLDTDELVARCARLRTLPSPSTEHRATVIALRRTARRALALEAEDNDLESELEKLVVAAVPALLAETGVGPISAAQLYVSWSHQGRLRNDGAFAMLGGSAPIPASVLGDRDVHEQGFVSERLAGGRGVGMVGDGLRLPEYEPDAFVHPPAEVHVPPRTATAQGRSGPPPRTRAGASARTRP